MKKYCNCGEEIHPLRLKATNGKAVTCIKCMHSNDVGKVRGFRIISGKDTYTELQIVDEETCARLNALQEREGQSPGNGIRPRR